VNKAISLHAGVENVFDKYYVDHLNGTNRVAGSDVAIGSRIPGAGQFFYVSGEYRW
jgi:iron complex outermembrane receptor protein